VLAGMACHPAVRCANTADTSGGPFVNASPVTRSVVLGVDWYRRGWVGVLLDANAAPVVIVDSILSALVARARETTCVAVDMPIGLPAREREADVLARRFVGRRRSSVFMTPPRQVLEAHSYPEANERASALLGGKKISQQAWALRHNIALVERLADDDLRVIEVHPEVSFRAMLDAELEYAKGTWNGQTLAGRVRDRGHRLRERQLAEAGVHTAVRRRA
jgi:predicted RNase H-like nuclease